MMIGWSYWSIIAITVSAQGSIRPKDGIQVYTVPFNTIIDSIYVSENQHVKRGDTLLSFITSDIDVQLDQNRYLQQSLTLKRKDLQRLLRIPETLAQFSLPRFRSDYEAVQNELRTFNVEISLNTLKHHRSLTLKSKNIISEAEYEEVKRALEISQTKRDEYIQNKKLQVQLELFNDETTLYELQGKEKSLIDEKANRCIVAHSSGYIYQLRVNKGGMHALVGQELFSLTPSADMQTEFYVPTKDIGFIKAGFPVRYEIDAFPFHEWGCAQGAIIAISDDIIIDAKTGIQYFKVIGSLDAGSLFSHRSMHTVQLTRGLNFRASITVAQKRLLEMVYDKTLVYLCFQK
jgi:HlyD family secretion protein